MQSRETILEEATRLTSGARRAAYGHPADHHAATAAAVTAYLLRRGLLAPGARFDAEDWELCVVLDKVIRRANRNGPPASRRDCLVDICGYARTVEMVEERQAEFTAPGRAALVGPEPQADGF